MSILEDLLVRLYEVIWRSYCNYMEDQINIIIPILVAILTGGFLMLFIENQHVASSVNERYRFIMKPFYHKLSNYFKFVGSFATFMRIKDRKAEYVKTFESYVDQMGKLAHPCIMDGMDYPVTYFKAEKLEQICNDINQIWYFWDRKRNYMKDSISYETERAQYHIGLGREYLHEVLPKFDDKPWTMSLLMSVSGDFYCNIWQPIQNVPYHYEYWQERTKEFSNLTIACIAVALATLAIILLLRFFIPIWVITALTAVSMALLGITLWKMVKLNALSAKLFE